MSELILKILGGERGEGRWMTTMDVGINCGVFGHADLAVLVASVRPQTHRAKSPTLTRRVHRRTCVIRSSMHGGEAYHTDIVAPRLGATLPSSRSVVTST